MSQPLRVSPRSGYLLVALAEKVCYIGTIRKEETFSMKKWIVLMLIVALSMSLVACQRTEKKTGNEKTDAMILEEIKAIYDDDTEDTVDKMYDEVGTCGEQIQWGYKKTTGELFVLGSGKMDDYTQDKPAYWNGLVLRSAKIQGVSTIGKFAFCGRDRLASVSISDGVTAIGESAFESCSSLRTINIPGSVTKIGDAAFEHCSALVDLTIPESVTSIGRYAFYDCDGLSTVVIPDGVESIGGHAFHSCDMVAYVTIPASVTSLGEAVFEECPNLTEINYGGTQEQWTALLNGAVNYKLYTVTVNFGS